MSERGARNNVNANNNGVGKTEVASPSLKYAALKRLNITFFLVSSLILD